MSRSTRARSERRLGWMLCAPAVAVMLLVTVYPITYAVALSLQHYNLRFPDDVVFVGLRNYVDVLTSRLWWQDFTTTVTITVISVVIELALGLGLALVMHRAVFGRRTVRTSILIPYGIITVVAALAWKFAFDPRAGFVNAVINSERDLLGERFTSLVVIIATEVWKTTPFISLVFLAGLTLVPEELHRAAKVDGANALQRFFFVTLPLMKPAVLVAVLFRTLDAFRIFDVVLVQTMGANQTETVSMLGYHQLINRLNLGMGSAISVLIFVAVMIIAVVFVRGFSTSLPQQREE